jgi:hypothetical protein
MNEIQNKAWNLLTEKEKQALTLGLGYAKSSWEVGEMMGLSHYKFLELKERAERFFKLFEGYFSKYPSLVRPNSLDDRFRDFIEGIIEKRMSRKEVSQYMGDSSLLVKPISTAMIIKWYKGLISSSDTWDKDLALLITEVDRWSNKRFLPRDIQLPSAYLRRIKWKDQSYMRWLIKWPIQKIEAIKKIYTNRAKEGYFIAISDPSNDMGYCVLQVKKNRRTILEMTSLGLYIFPELVQADVLGYMISKYSEKANSPKSGMRFWRDYRDNLKMAMNYNELQNLSILPRPEDIEFSRIKKIREKRKEK